uniref:Uncharacterized protein n=1 Tax=Glossina austeni TaxID=7395 RepID=A0A1A9UGJ8_GLOAU
MPRHSTSYYTITYLGVRPTKLPEDKIFILSYLLTLFLNAFNASTCQSLSLYRRTIKALANFFNTTRFRFRATIRELALTLRRPHGLVLKDAKISCPYERWFTT